MKIILRTHKSLYLIPTFVTAFILWMLCVASPAFALTENHKGIQYYIDRSKSHHQQTSQRNKIQGYISSTEAASLTDTTSSRTGYLQKINFSSEDRQTLTRYRNNQHQKPISIILAEGYDSAFLTTYATTQGNHVHLVIAAGPQFGGLRKVYEQRLGMVNTHSLPSGRGSQEEAICRVTNYAEAALTAKAKNKMYTLNDLKAFDEHSMQFITHIRPIIKPEQVNQWLAALAAGKRRQRFFSDFLDEQESHGKNIYNTAFRPTITAYRAVGPRANRRGVIDKHESAHRQVTSQYRALLRSIYRGVNQARPNHRRPVLITPPLSTFAYAHLDGKLDSVFRDRMIEGHVKAIILEASRYPSLPPRVIIPVGQGEKEIYEKYCRRYNVGVTPFNLHKMGKSESVSSYPRKRAEEPTQQDFSCKIL